LPSFHSSAKRVQRNQASKEREKNERVVVVDDVVVAVVVAAVVAIVVAVIFVAGVVVVAYLSLQHPESFASPPHQFHLTCASQHHCLLLQHGCWKGEGEMEQEAQL
jgi:uncharacterized membrane protein YhdT